MEKIEEELSPEEIEEFSEEIDAVTGSDLNPFEGTDPPPKEEPAPPEEEEYQPPPAPPQYPPVQSYQPSYRQDVDDGTPKTLDEVEDLDSYTKYVLREAGKEIDRRATQRELDHRVASTEAAARERHDGSDGWPEYLDSVDNFVVPLIRSSPRVFEVLRTFQNPAESSYVLGLVLKYQQNLPKTNHDGSDGWPDWSTVINTHVMPLVQRSPQIRDLLNLLPDPNEAAFVLGLLIKYQEKLPEMIRSRGNFRATVRGRYQGRNQGTGKLTKADYDSMSIEAFVQELDRFKNSEEGERRL
jgi:hypothetical protein